MSGIWTALAHDFAHGIFYRPIFDGESYGGTRYMPLFFVLHGGLIKLGMAPIAAGIALSMASMVLLLAGLYRILRLAGLPPRLAAPLTFLPAASINFLLLTLEIKGDFPAAALNLLGLVCVLEHERRRQRRGHFFQPKKSAFLLPAAGLFFAGAFLTKLSTLYGLAAGLVFLTVSGRFRDALKLAVPAALVMAFGLALIHLGSDGRALASFRACAPGGMDTGYALHLPVWFFRAARQDPFFLVFLGVALFHFILTVKKRPKSLPYLYFVITAAATLILFATPGADGNHLLDLLIASVLIIGLNLDAAYPVRLINYAAAAGLALMVASTFIPGAPSIKTYMDRTGKPTREAVALIRDRLGPGPSDLLSENPLLPVLMGERPILLDAFQLRLTARRNPEIESAFNRRLEDREFAAVVIMDWSGEPTGRLTRVLARHRSNGGRLFYGHVHFFPGFLERLYDNYELTFRHGPFVMYEPRGGKQPGGGAEP